MPDDMPTCGDVVIHAGESHASTRHSVSAVPGPPQFSCATRAEAERLARAYAERSGVDLWFSARPHEVTRLARFRPPARQRTMAEPVRQAVRLAARA